MTPERIKRLAERVKLILDTKGWVIRWNHIYDLAEAIREADAVIEAEDREGTIEVELAVAAVKRSGKVAVYAWGIDECDNREEAFCELRENMNGYTPLTKPVVVKARLPLLLKTTTTVEGEVTQ